MARGHLMKPGLEGRGSGGSARRGGGYEGWGKAGPTGYWRGGRMRSKLPAGDPMAADPRDYMNSRKGSPSK
jgi:hypothetical protein